MPVERLEVDKISRYRSARGWGGAIAGLYETHWKGLLRPSWEREADLLHARQCIVDTTYYAFRTTPDRSSSRCLRLGTLRLLEPFATHLQVHQGSSLMRGIVRNVDESRGAEIAGSGDLDTPP